MTFDPEDAASGNSPSQPQDECESNWFLVYTKPRQEDVALLNLQRQGFHTYLPRYKSVKKASAGMPIVFEPLFPRYVFFRPASPAQSISSVRSTRGVVTIVSFGGEPALVRDEILRDIQQFERQRNEADLDHISPFQPGKEVRLRNSPLNGLTGLVKSVSSQRVAVLLELLGRQKEVAVGHHQLELA